RDGDPGPPPGGAQLRTGDRRVPPRAVGPGERLLPGGGPAVNVAAVRSLAWKELRQVRRSKRTLVTAVFMPLIFMGFIPLQQALLFRGGSSRLDRAVVMISTTSPQAEQACATVVDAGGDPAPATPVQFRVGTTTIGSGVTDPRGRVCGGLPTDLLPGDYELRAVPLTGQFTAHPSRLVVTGPPPRTYLILPPASATALGTGFSGTDLLLKFLLPFYIFMAGTLVP